jgi:hypothetical protein
MGANGTADTYYEGPGNILWVEYKAVQSACLPKIIEVIKNKPCLSPLQRRWVNRAHSNHVPVAVILGSLEGAVIFTQGGWEYEYEKKRLRLSSPQEVAEFIHGVVLEGGPCDHRIFK